MNPSLRLKSSPIFFWISCVLEPFLKLLVLGVALDQVVEEVHLADQFHGDAPFGLAFLNRLVDLLVAHLARQIVAVFEVAEVTFLSSS